MSEQVQGRATKKVAKARLQTEQVRAPVTDPAGRGLGIFLQARMDSSRLPRKALLPLAGRTVIEHVMTSLRRVSAEVHLLVTDEASYPELEPYAKGCGFLAFAGPKEDVLARFALAVGRHPVDRIVRATGDNPLVSIALIELLLPLHGEAHADYSAFAGPPIGTGVEIIETRALFEAAKRSVDPYEREHVCPYLYRRGEVYRIHRPTAPEYFCLSDASVTLDTEADYRFLDRLYEELYRGDPIDTRRLVEWLSANTERASSRDEGYTSGKEGTPNTFAAQGAARPNRASR